MSNVVPPSIESTATKVSVVCVSLISKENSPLFIKNYMDDEDLNLHRIVYASLDMIENRLLPQNGTAKPPSDMYFGLLCSLEDCRVYGYLTSTQMKIIVVCKDVGEPLESGTKLLFNGIHKSYVQAVLNPFAELGSKLDSPKFMAEVNKHVDRFNQQT